MQFELDGGGDKTLTKSLLLLPLSSCTPHHIPLSRPLLSGCEVDILSVRCLHPAGGSADAEHYGGVRLAHFLHRHVKVPWLPGVHQHPENYGGQQVGSITLQLPPHFYLLTVSCMYLIISNSNQKDDAQCIKLSLKK